MNANGILFCDTNLIVIKIWSEFKYGMCNEEILKQMYQKKYDLHLLTDIDLPWEPDPMREHPDRREELFQLYVSELKNQNIDYRIVSGADEKRIESAIQAVDEFLR